MSKLILENYPHYAHSSISGLIEENEKLVDHLNKTGLLTKQYSKHFCDGDYAENIGRLHDIGKHTEEFQKKIITSSDDDVKHAKYGARLALDYKMGELAAFIINGHHTGLQDMVVESATVKSPFNTLVENETINFTENGKINSASDTEYMKKFFRFIDPSKDQVSITNLPAAQSSELVDIKRIFMEPTTRYCCSNDDALKILEYSYYVRMLYSALVDADYIATEDYYNSQRKKDSEYYVKRWNDEGFSFKDCLKKVQDKLDGFKELKDAKNKKSVTYARNKIRDKIMDEKDSESSLFYMNMPTGSGKTLASLEFALYRAISRKKDRLVYVIPYTSIIDQNAKVFKDLLGEGLVLEHHSNFDYETILDKETSKRIARASENWDMPIVVTTNVQFFESMHGNKPSKLRKLHNVANSVIIFDEAHMLPTNLLYPCLGCIHALSTYYKCDIIMSSATMPNFRGLFGKFDSFPNACQLVNREKMQEEDSDENCYDNFIRYNIFTLEKDIYEDELIMESANYNSALIVVNKKDTARSIYNRYKSMIKEGKTSSNRKYKGRKIYHLSTNMTQHDRLLVISKVKSALKNRKKVTLVSTSLIEAGVDLDFASVFRERNGIDSLLQAAGRCNREGKRKGKNGLEGGAVYDFKFNETSVNEDNEKSKSKAMAKDINIKNDMYKGVLLERSSIIDPKDYNALIPGTQSTKEISKLIDDESAIKRYFDKFTNMHSNGMLKLKFMPGKIKSGISSCGFLAKTPDPTSAKKIYPRIGKFKEQYMIQFNTYAKAFKLIDDETTPVIIASKNLGKKYNEEVMAIMNSSKTSAFKLVRDLQKYSVAIRDDDFILLKDLGLIIEKKLGYGVVVYQLNSDNHYNKNTGIKIE